MKLLYWTEAYWPTIGGVEILSRQVLPRLQAASFDPVVLTSQDDPALPAYEVLDDIPIYRLPFHAGLTPNNLRQLLQVQRQTAELKRKLKPDIVHLHLVGPMAFYHLRTLTAWAAPTLITLHISVEPRQMQADSILAQALRQAEHVVGVSQAVLDYAAAAVPPIRQKSSVIYNAVAELERQPSPISTATPIILCLGRIVAEKGFDLMLAAMPAVLANRGDARLIIAGDGPECAALQALAQTLGIADSVHFTGWVDESTRWALLDQATVVVVPSRWQEAFGLVAIEAAWMGRPVIVTRRGGLPEAVRDGETGLVVEPEDSQALSQAVLDILSDPVRACAMGRAAREMAETRFNLDRYIREYADLYHMIFNRENI